MYLIPIDVDAVYRMTNRTPMSFGKKLDRILMVPTGSTFAPYNAQATVHFRTSFFALYLPVTVNGRVSDIW